MAPSHLVQDYDAMSIAYLKLFYSVKLSCTLAWSPCQNHDDIQQFVAVEIRLSCIPHRYIIGAPFDTFELLATVRSSQSYYQCLRLIYLTQIISVNFCCMSCLPARQSFDSFSEKNRVCRCYSVCKRNETVRSSHVTCRDYVGGNKPLIRSWVNISAEKEIILSVRLGVSVLSEINEPKHFHD